MVGIQTILLLSRDILQSHIKLKPIAHPTSMTLLISRHRMQELVIIIFTILLYNIDICNCIFEQEQLFLGPVFQKFYKNQTSKSAQKISLFSVNQKINAKITLKKNPYLNKNINEMFI